MFIMMADIKLKEGAEDDFARWFSESNKALSKFPGFVSRRFLRSQDGNHRIIIEHQSRETFIKMHQSPEHERLHPTGRSFLSQDPVKKSFTVISQ